MHDKFNDDVSIKQTYVVAWKNVRLHWVVVKYQKLLYLSLTY